MRSCFSSPLDYVAPGQFTLNVTVSVEHEGESCNPSVLLIFAGIGPGEHPYHQLEVVQLVVLLTDRCRRVRMCCRWLTRPRSWTGCLPASTVSA